jgi:hypothetical protein
MANLIIFGSVWFWILISAALGLIVWFLESALSDLDEDSGGGFEVTALLIGLGVAYYFCGSKEHVISALEFVRDHPLKLFGWVGLYLLVGVIWAFIKWYFFLLKSRDRQVERKKNSQYKDIEIPTAADNKFRILTWMNYWVFSVIWTALDEPVKRFFNFIFKKLEGRFDKISNSIFKDVKGAK